MRCDVLLVAGGKAAAGDGHLYALKVESKVRDVRAAIAAGAALRIRDEAAFAKEFGFPAGRRLRVSRHVPSRSSGLSRLRSLDPLARPTAASTVVLVGALLAAGAARRVRGHARRARVGGVRSAGDAAAIVMIEARARSSG